MAERAWWLHGPPPPEKDRSAISRILCRLLGHRAGPGLGGLCGRCGKVGPLGTDLYLKPVVVPGTVVETHDDGSGWVTVEVVDTDGSTVVLFDVPAHRCEVRA